MKLKSLVLIVLLATLQGCGVFMKPEPIVVTKKEIVYTHIPDTLLVKCQASKPIPIEEYLSLDPIGRETYLTNYSVQLLGVIKDCDDRFTSIVKLQPKK